MKPWSFLMGGILAGAAAVLAVRGLWLLDFSPFPSLKTSVFLPHLFIGPNMAAHPVLPNWHLERLLPLVLAAHAIAILLAAALAAWVTARAAPQPWAPPLVLTLGGLSFYVAHFCFVHPGAPLSSATLGGRILDYVAVGSLALGCFSLVHFFLKFPVTHDHGAFLAYRQREDEPS
jgi:hypothetical protein